MSELYEKLEREILPLVTRPSRYVGGERNVPEKDPGDVALNFLLAFPDAYEIGMSHLGIRVLYDVLNRRPDIAAERCFAPWVDMERLMREKSVPLFSLETHRPARDFDIIGVTLQYELHYTNVLAMLDLAGVPLHSEDRCGDDPLIVGGGPCAANPEPVAPFFDIIVLGDGESAVIELSDLVIEGRRKGWGRAELLRRASELRGFYVPSLGQERVMRRLEPSLGYADHPSTPIVPVTETTHDRLSIEIMRGCTRGCRFCQPGMITRPVRMRPVDDVARLISEGIACTGYDEVSLVSLSTSDYDDLGGLISTLNERLFDRKVSISLPSLRVDSFTLALADGIGRVRRAGLTFAPEAGTQRLRDVINKNETEESILETIDTAFEAGWNRVKLYFMIGLPTETEEDLRGIVALVSKVRTRAKGRGRGAAVNVSISPFVPRAHTPFQWEAQDLPEVTEEKERFLRRALGHERGVRIATRDPMVSFLEGVMARGDRALAPVIERAFRAGARFDGWTETFDYGRWDDAFRAEGVEPRDYLAARDPDAPLPWSHLDAGPSIRFLLSEREKAMRAALTPDCRAEGCFACGACEEAGVGPPGEVNRPGTAVRPRVARETGGEGGREAGLAGDEEAAALQDPRDRAFGRRDRRIRTAESGEAPLRWRVRYRKGGRLRFLSHLDIVRIVLRAIAMSGLPVVYTQGFNPHPKVSFGPPLPVGSTGDAEFFEFELGRNVGGEEIERGLKTLMPHDLPITGLRQLTTRTTVSAVAEAAEYLITGLPGFESLTSDEIRRRLDVLRRTREAQVPKGGSEKTVRPSECILSLEMVSDTIAGGESGRIAGVERREDNARSRAIRAVLAIGKPGALRPLDVARLLSPEESARPELAYFHRIALLGKTAGLPGLEPIT